jgi:enterobacterial common antigen flippase
MNGRHQYRSMVRATTLVASGSLVALLFTLVRTKALALLLGPAGVGLAGLYATLMAPLVILGGLGMETSGVRQIAAAEGQGDQLRAGAVTRALLRLGWLAGLAGGLVTAGLARPLSRWTFQSHAHAAAVALLGFAVLFSCLAAFHSSVLQGHRRLGALVRLAAWSAAGGTLLAILCYAGFGMRGIVPALLLNALVSALVSGWLVRRASGGISCTGPVRLRAEALGLLRLGLPLMATALMGACVSYAARLIVLRQFALDGLGLWSAAVNISGVLVSFVLAAMGTDYYPRLAGLAHDAAEFSRAVNTQVEIALCLALPALLATLLFAPLGLRLLYSGQFDAAIPVLRWSVFGMFLRVVTWPLGFVILAQGRGGLYFLNDLYVHVIYLAALVLGGRAWGLAGLGIAGLLQYAGYLLFILPVAWLIARAAWNRPNCLRIFLAALLLAAASCLVRWVRHPLLFNGIGALAVAGVAAWAALNLSRKTGFTLPGLLSKGLGGLRSLIR